MAWESDTAHAYTFEATTELSVAKEEFKFNAAHFVVLEVSAVLGYSELRLGSLLRPLFWATIRMAARARVPARSQLPGHSGASRRD